MELSQTVDDEQGLKRELASMGVEGIPGIEASTDRRRTTNMAQAEREAKVYVNGSLVGTHPDPEALAEQIREARRRRGDVSEMVNVSVKDRTQEVIVNADAGRARRPLIVVENGEPPPGRRGDRGPRTRRRGVRGSR